ncbi:hypothetical protein B0H13DRAFT_1870000 [Mycena leptocephala]|nr:hypothetical protein B0H13DRAFT_1870000 [Mycena leptocephala]
MDASESRSQNSGKQLNNWPLLASLVLLLYDYLLTLPTEIRIVWLHQGPGSCSSTTWPSVQTSPWLCLPSESSDLRWISILTLCVYALFNRKGVIIWLLSLAGIGSLAVGVGICLDNGIIHQFSHLVQFAHPLLVLWAEQSASQARGRQTGQLSLLAGEMFCPRWCVTALEILCDLSISGGIVQLEADSVDS